MLMPVPAKLIMNGMILSKPEYETENCTHDDNDEQYRQVNGSI